jgi:hypothetical protein
MLKRLLILAVGLALLGGCGPYRDVLREQFDTLPQHYSHFDARLAWETQVVGPEIRIEGVVENTRYYEMDGLEIWVSLRDAKGDTVTRSASFVIPDQFRQYEIAHFGLVLPAQPFPGAKLLFTYRYTAHDGKKERTNWMQSFEAELPGQ